MEIILIFCWDGCWKFRKNYSPTKLGRDIGIVVDGRVPMKPVISWEDPYNQLGKVGTLSLVYEWVGLYIVTSEIYCYCISSPFGVVLKDNGVGEILL